jgi:hypothetical protein
MASQIFISHSSTDRLAVETIRSQLAAIGVNPYLYEYDLRPREGLADKLRNAIAASDAMVVFLTADTAESQSVHQEVGIALALKKPVIPLVEAGVDTKQLALLSGLEYAVFDPQRPQEALTAMTNQVHRLLAEQERRPNLTSPVAAVPPVVVGEAPALQPQPYAGANRELAVVLAFVGAILIVALLTSRG